MVYEDSLELIFAMESMPSDFKWIGRGHREEVRDCSNRYPGVHFRLDSFVWDLKLPEGKGLEEWILQRLWDDFEELIQPNCEKHLDFKPIFDVDGYNLLCKIPLYDCLEERDELKEGLKYPEDHDQIIDDLEDNEQGIINHIKTWQKFLEWVKGYEKGIKEELKEQIVVTDGEDFNFIHPDFLEDGWVKWEGD